MSALVYLVAEGVHDVTFLGKLLVMEHGAQRIQTMGDLDVEHRPWLGSFSWPIKVRVGKPDEKIEIQRLSVPAPSFYRLGDGRTVALRNAQGISNIFTMIERDQESFLRDEITPDAVGIVLDSDEDHPAQRFQKLKKAILRANLAVPTALGEIAEGSPRVGVFSLPGPDTRGTLEDLLVALGDVAYPELMTAAHAYAKDWRTRAEADTENEEWDALRKPAGAKKATLGAMSAVLKPGKAIQVSLEDNRWVSAATKDVPGLRACVAFLGALLGARGEAAPVATLEPASPTEGAPPAAG